MPQTVLSWWWWKMAEMFSLTNAHESTWCLWNLLDVKTGTQTIRHWWRKLKETQINGKIYCSHVLQELILLKYSYYAKQSIGSTHAGMLSGVQIFATSQIVDCQAPLSVEFSRQEYWSRLSFSAPGDLADTATEPTSPELAGRFFTTESPGKCIVSM